MVIAGRSLQRSMNLMKDMVVGGMANQRVNGNGFSQRGKIAHVHLLLGVQPTADEPYGFILDSRAAGLRLS